MDHKTEAQLLAAMASAPTLEEQQRLTAELDAVRANKTAAARAQTESMWTAEAIATAMPHRAEYSRSTRESDWLGDVVAAKADPEAAETQMRAEASQWYSRLHPGVKAHPGEVLIQAAALSDIRSSQFGPVALRAQAAFLDQIKHHAETEGLPIPDPASIRPEPYEHGQYSGDTQTDAADTPSLAEGEQPASDEAPSQGTTQENLDASTWPEHSEEGWKNADEPPGKEASRKMAYEEKTVALVYDRESKEVYDRAFNWQTADSMANEGYVAVAIDDDGDYYTKDRINRLLETTMTAYEDLYGIEKWRPEPDLLSTASRKQASEGGQTCATCGDKIAKDPSSEDPSTWHHDNGESHDHEAKPGKEAARRKTAGEYTGGSPKEGDTATCHKGDGPIQFFAGEWMHLKGGGSHNDVYPASKAKGASRKTASGDWVTVVFMDGDEGREVVDRLANVEDGYYVRGATEESIQEAAEYLADWDYADMAYPTSSGEPWGSQDETAEVTVNGTQYTLAWNVGLSYVSLQRRAEHTASRKRAARVPALSSLASKITVADKQDEPALKALARLKSAEDTFHGISGKQVISHLLTVARMDDDTRRTLRAALAPKTADCGYCGSSEHTFEEGHPGEARWHTKDTGDNGGAQWEDENSSNRRS